MFMHPMITRKRLRNFRALNSKTKMKVAIATLASPAPKCSGVRTSETIWHDAFLVNRDLGNQPLHEIYILVQTCNIVKNMQSKIPFDHLIDGLDIRWPHIRWPHPRFWWPSRRECKLWGGIGQSFFRARRRKRQRKRCWNWENDLWFLESDISSIAYIKFSMGVFTPLPKMKRWTATELNLVMTITTTAMIIDAISKCQTSMSNGRTNLSNWK